MAAVWVDCGGANVEAGRNLGDYYSNLNELMMPCTDILSVEVEKVVRFWIYICTVNTEPTEFNDRSY